MNTVNMPEFPYEPLCYCQVAMPCLYYFKLWQVYGQALLCIALFTDALMLAGVAGWMRAWGVQAGDSVSFEVNCLDPLKVNLPAALHSV